MHLRPLALGLIVVGLLALGGALDGIRRQFMRDPVWFAQNFGRVIKGAALWILVGGLAVGGGILGMIL
jgi:hypothetical protein